MSDRQETTGRPGTVGSSTSVATAGSGPSGGLLLHVDEKDAKKLILVMTVELEDGGRLLTRAQREAASGLIWAGLPNGGKNLSERDWVRKFLLPRAQRLLDEAAAKSPRIRRVLEPSTLQATLVAVLLVGALLTGFLADRIPNADRINLIAAPLGLIILWNWVGMIAAVAVPLFSRSARPIDGIRRLMGAGSRLLAWSPRAHSWFAHVVEGYLRRWVDVAAPLLQARLTHLLHWAAIAMAIGAICSLTWAAWHEEFRVGWSSTLCKEKCVHVVHSAFFLPTMPLTELIGAAPFSAEEVKQMQRWEQPDNGEGERWFRLTAALLLVTVIAPRLLLAIGARWRAARLSSRLLLDFSDPYFRQLREPPEPAQTAGPTPQPTRPERPRGLMFFWRRAWAWFKDLFRRGSIGA